jgi:ZIP family zinc transporter
VLGIALAFALIGPRFLGGYSVLRGRDRLHLAMGFAGGALLGVAVWDTLPEAVELFGKHGLLLALAAAAVGALTFKALEGPVFGHVHEGDAECNPQAGYIGAGGISVHNFLDGLAIGSAFEVSTKAGILVSIAILLHAFSDGLNTVTVVLRHGLGERKAITWLAIDAVMPVLGASLALFLDLPDVVLACLLGYFAGMFLYLGAGSLLPQAHRHGRDRHIVWPAAAGAFAVAWFVAQIVA